METKRVVVLPYDEQWKQDYLRIKAELTDALGPSIIGIEHVGSTSVPGLSAKPIIDIDVIIKDHSVLKDVVSELEKSAIDTKATLASPGGRPSHTTAKNT